MVRKINPLLPRLLLVATLGLSLAACSSSFRYPGKSFFQPEKKSSAPARAAPAPAPSQGGGSTGGQGSPDDPVAQVEGWQKAGVTQEEGVADTDSCYHYANAQVTKDIQIDRDIDAARGVGGTVFQQSGNLDRGVDAYYYDNQRVSRFESCMRSRGYTRN